MKRILAVIFTVIILSGCSNSKAIEPGLQLREKLLNSNGCSFDALITADYADEIYTFTMQCEIDQNGNLSFCVKEPISISGITGTMTADGGKLTFDDKALAFPLLADDQITPISGPWLLLKTLRGGYLRACETGKNETHLILDDSYQEDALQVDVYLTKENIPIRGEFLFRGRRILSIDVRNFAYL